MSSHDVWSIGSDDEVGQVQSARELSLGSSQQSGPPHNGVFQGSVSTGLPVAPPPPQLSPSPQPSMQPSTTRQSSYVSLATNDSGSSKEAWSPEPASQTLDDDENDDQFEDAPKPKPQRRKSSLLNLSKIRENVSKFFGGDEETIARWQDLYYKDDDDEEEQVDEPESDDSITPTPPVGDRVMPLQSDSGMDRRKSMKKQQQNLASIKDVFKDTYQKAKSIRRKSSHKGSSKDLEMQDLPRAGRRESGEDDEWFGGDGGFVTTVDVGKSGKPVEPYQPPPAYDGRGPPNQPKQKKDEQQWFGFDSGNVVQLPQNVQQQSNAGRSAQSQQQHRSQQGHHPQQQRNPANARPAPSRQQQQQKRPNPANAKAAPSRQQQQQQRARQRQGQQQQQQQRKPQARQQGHDPTRAKAAPSRQNPSNAKPASSSSSAPNGPVRRADGKLDTNVRDKVRAIREHRAFFTYYMTFCQIAVMIIAITVNGLAPISFTSNQESATVDGPDGAQITATRDLNPNFWLGPRPEVLVLYGAKFSPCMRKDARVYEEIIDPQSANSNDIGCCMDQGTTGGNCYTSTASECTGFKQFAAGFPCGGEQCCSDFSGNSSVSYPNCQKVSANATTETSCRCTITARPCCVDLVGTCEYQSQEYCDFVQGHYHADVDSCDQVSCLESSCGLVPFISPTYPDQWYRLYLALFLHVGIIHLIFVLLFQHSIATDIEKLAGWLRMLFLYFLSGMGGYLVSAMFTPYQVSTGASPALYGLLGCLFVELFQAWQLLDNPLREFFKLLTIALIALAIGLLPYVDNWSHVGGFVFGTLSAMVFLPYITFGKWDAARKRIMVVIALAGIVALFTIGFSLFLTNQPKDCAWCGYLNCIDFVENFCSENSQDMM